MKGGAGSRGYIDFVNLAHAFDFYNNVFYASPKGIVLATETQDSAAYHNRFLNVTSQFSGGVVAFNNFINGELVASGDMVVEKTVILTLDDFTAGFINKNTGAVETNSSFPRAVVSSLVELEQGRTYTLTSDISATTNDTGVRIRIYDTDDAFKLAVDANSLDNNYTSISYSDGGSHYYAKTINITPKVDCKIRINYLDTNYVTTAELAV